MNYNIILFTIKISFLYCVLLVDYRSFFFILTQKIYGHLTHETCRPRSIKFAATIESITCCLPSSHSPLNYRNKHKVLGIT